MTVTCRSVGAGLLLAMALASCGADAHESDYLSCESYLKLSEDARQDVVSDTAEKLDIMLVSAGIGGKGAPQLYDARITIDARCRSASVLQIDEALVGAELDVRTTGAAENQSGMTRGPSQPATSTVAGSATPSV